MLRYCRECLYPETKFDLTFDANGVCSACTAYKRRETIDWGERCREFARLRREAEKLDTRWRVIVPVSGAK
jgi:hypothetical protein